MINTAIQQPHGWQAFLQMRFAKQHGKTVLAQRSHKGPLQVQKAFYPEEGGACHVYVLHPPGGIAGGDELNIAVSAEDQTHALITTPAANKFYRSNGAIAQLAQTLCVTGDAVLEWLPQEAIVFDAACVHSATKVMLDDKSVFFGWDITCFGRPAAREKFITGHYRNRFEIWRNGMPLWFEHTVLSGDDPMMNATFGMRGYSVTGTFVYAGQAAHALPRLRDITKTEDALFAVTQLKNVLLCRYLGHHAEQARMLFMQAWKILRPLVIQCDAQAPRIWHT